MGQALARLILYAGIIAFVVVIASILGPSSGNWVHEAGKCFALAGFSILVLQFFLASRVRWIERAFGLDILIRFHKHMAVFATFLVLLHPVLLAASEGNWNLIIGWDLPWYIWVGKAALVVVIVSVLLSLYQSLLHLKFETWRRLHNVGGVAIVAFAFTHSWVAGGDLDPIPMKALWIAGLVLLVMAYLGHRVFGPLRRKRHPYRVVGVHPEAEDVWTLRLAPPEGEDVPFYLPGQFHFITLYRGRNLPVEEHHWTISSPPTETQYVSSTIKAVGDFTSTIGETREGDRAAVQGPFGRFSYALHPEERDLVFIAGGIGITPLMSMLRHMRDSKDDRSVLLLYANRFENQILFREELANMENGSRPSLEVAHVLSRPGEEWSGEIGHVDREKITRFCGRSLEQKVFYVCGPQGMREAVVVSLKDLGVRDPRIRVEIFSFLD